MTSEQRDIALMVSLLLAWTSSWTNSWVASHEITMMMVIRSRDSSPFTTTQWCLFNANQKKAFEQIVKFYNEHCVWRGCRKCPFHRYWILIIPWLNKLLNKQTGCIAFPINIVVVLKKHTTHTAAEQPAQFYANHASTAAEQPDQFKYIPTAWLEKTLARPNPLLQHKCRAVCQMLYRSHSCRAACSVLHKSHQHSCGAPGQGQMYSYSMVGWVPG